MFLFCFVDSQVQRFQFMDKWAPLFGAWDEAEHHWQKVFSKSSGDNISMTRGEMMWLKMGIIFNYTFSKELPKPNPIVLSIIYFAYFKYILHLYTYIFKLSVNVSVWQKFKHFICKVH